MPPFAVPVGLLGARRAEMRESECPNIILPNIILVSLDTAMEPSFLLPRLRKSSCEWPAIVKPPGSETLGFVGAYGMTRKELQETAVACSRQAAPAARKLHASAAAGLTGDDYLGFITSSSTVPGNASGQPSLCGGPKRAVGK